MSSIAEQSFQVPVPAYTLFDANSVTLATILGSPVAGSSLMARSLQGPAVMDHVQRDGRLGSKWTGFGLGAAICAVIFLPAFIPAYAGDHQPGVVIGTKDEVYYSGTATKEDAQSLGNALKEHGYFNDKGASDKGADVFLAKGKDGTTISFVTKEGSWEQPDIVSLFEEIGREVAPSVGGFPIQVRILNIQYEVEKESNVGSAIFAGEDTVYYLGGATASEAQALGQAFKSIDFFQGKGADVFLSKHSDGATLSFVVGDGVWNDPAYVADFEKIVRDAAPAAGGLPIRLRLVNALLEVKKDEVIN